MTTPFDEDDAPAIVNDGPPSDEQIEAMICKLDDVLSDCALYNRDENGVTYVDWALDYLDHLAATPGQLHWLLIHLRWEIAKHDADQRDRAIETEFAALLQAEVAKSKAVGVAAVPLPLTCVSPEAHAREARRTKPLWWLRFAGLLDGDAPDGAVCAICAKPYPRSHRRKS